MEYKMQAQKDMSQYSFMQLEDGDDVSEELLKRHSQLVETDVAPKIKDLQERKEKGARVANKYILF